MNLLLLCGHVLTKRVGTVHRTASGIKTLDAAAKNPMGVRLSQWIKGTRLMDESLRILDIRVGDGVPLGKRAGQAVKIKNGGNYANKKSFVSR